MKCLNCNKNDAQYKEPYGYLPCTSCVERQRAFKVREAIEITTGEIKESRKQYSRDILQRQRGSTPSLEYIKQYGTKGFSKEEVKQARNVWGNDYYQDKTERHKETRTKERV